MKPDGKYKLIPVHKKNMSVFLRDGCPIPKLKNAPKDMEVVHAFWDHDNYVIFRVHSKEFPMVPEAAEIPLYDPDFFRKGSGW